MRSLFLASLLLLACLSPAVAADPPPETRLQELNCAVTLPDGPQWTRPSSVTPVVKAAAQTSDRTASVVLTVVDLSDSSAKLNSEFITQFEQGYFPADRSKKTSSTQLTLQGVPGYKATGEFYVNGKTMQRAIYLWIADGKIYNLVAMKLDAPPFEDTTLRAAMDSFHFLSPPKT